MTIDLYYAIQSAPCRRVLMTIKQLNLDVNMKPLDLVNKSEHLSPEFVKINPAHTIPTLVDGDLTLWESRAILQYLCNMYAPDSSLYPNDPKKRAIVDRTLNFDISYYRSIQGALLNKVFQGVEPTEQQVTDYKNNLKLLNTLIGDNKYVAGNELTIADLAVVVSTTPLGVNDYEDLNDLPNLKAWFLRLEKELPYFQEVNGSVVKWMKKRLTKK